MRSFSMRRCEPRVAIDRKLWRDGYDHEKKLAEFIREHAAELSYLD
jgi:hypothetical protein